MPGPQARPGQGISKKEVRAMAVATAAASCPRRRGRPGTRGLFPRGRLRTLPGEDTAGAASAEGPEGEDVRLRELRDRLELELLQLGEEQCECVMKLKEQHAAQVPESGRGEEGRAGEGRGREGEEATARPHTFRILHIEGLLICLA